MKGKLFPWGDPLYAIACKHFPEGNPMKKVLKPKRPPKARDPEQFQRFIEAARKRGINESLEEFAVRFGKSLPPKAKPPDE